MTNLNHMLEGYYVLYKRWQQREDKKIRFSREKLIYPFRLLIHPLSVFNDLKFENKASAAIAFVISLLFFLERAAEQVGTSYLFNPKKGEPFSLSSVLAFTIGLLILWTVCNWAMCTLNNGEGKMSEIWIAVSYSLVPYIILGFINIGLSQIFSSEEAIIYSSIEVFRVGWSVVLAFLGLLTVHQYTVKKTIVSVILTILAMLAVCFLLLLFFSISQQIFGFVSGLYQELLYR